MACSLLHTGASSVLSRSSTSGRSSLKMSTAARIARTKSASWGSHLQQQAGAETMRGGAWHHSTAAQSSNSSNCGRGVACSRQQCIIQCWQQAPRKHLQPGMVAGFQQNPSVPAMEPHATAIQPHPSSQSVCSGPGGIRGKRSTLLRISTSRLVLGSCKGTMKQQDVP